MVGSTAMAIGVAVAEAAGTGVAVGVAMDATGGALVGVGCVDGTAAALAQAATAPATIKVTIATRIDCMMDLLGEHPDAQRSSCPTGRSIRPQAAKTRSCGPEPCAAGAASP